MIACTKYCLDVVPELAVAGGANKAKTPAKVEPLIIADSWSSKSQEILAARPDLVIAAVPYQESAVVEILKAGIRFLGLAPRTLEDIYGDIALIAGTVGAVDRGERVIEDMRTAIENMRAAAATFSRRRVFCRGMG